MSSLPQVTAGLNPGSLGPDRVLTATMTFCISLLHSCYQKVTFPFCPKPSLVNPTSSTFSQPTPHLMNFSSHPYLSLYDEVDDYLVTIKIYLLFKVQFSTQLALKWTMTVDLQGRLFFIFQQHFLSAHLPSTSPKPYPKLNRLFSYVF